MSQQSKPDRIQTPFGLRGIIVQLRQTRRLWFSREIPSSITVFKVLFCCRGCGKRVARERTKQGQRLYIVHCEATLTTHFVLEDGCILIDRDSGKNVASKSIVLEKSSFFKIRDLIISHLEIAANTSLIYRSGDTDSFCFCFDLEFQSWNVSSLADSKGHFWNTCSSFGSLLGKQLLDCRVCCPLGGHIIPLSF